MMRQQELADLANAAADAIGRMIGDDAGFVLIVVHAEPGGEVWYRTDLEEEDAAGVLDDCADHLRAVWKREI